MATEDWSSRLLEILHWELQEFPVLQIVAVLGTTALVLHWFWQWRRDRRKNYPPGLPALPLVGSLPFMKMPDNNPHLQIVELFEKYGNIHSVWLGNRLVVNIGGYDVIREALVDQSVAFAGRPNEFMNITKIVNPKVIGIAERSYCPAWKQDRNVALTILREFGFGRNLMEQRIMDEVESLIGFIKGLNGEPYNPRETLMTSVGNVICSIILGRRYPLDGCAELQEVIGDMDLICIRGSTLFPLFFIPALLHIPHYKRLMNEALESHKRIDKFLRDMVREHEESYHAGKEDDFIDAYIGHVGKDSDYKEDLVFLLRDLLLAGTETTATTLHWAMLYMANYPHIQTKVQEEIEREVGKDRTVTLQNKSRLPYTEAVLQEIQRINVLLPFSLPHRTLSDVKLRGYDIPENTVVMVYLWTVLRDPNLWPEPDKFIPERFLDEQGNVVYRPELINFSLGRRSCLGEVMARQEVFLVFCGLMQNFTMRAPEGVGKFDEKGATFVIRSPLPFKIIAEPRH